MKRVFEKLCKTKGIVKRIFSVALSVVLMSSMVQTLPVGILQANAASSDVHVTMHFYNQYNWTQPVLQYWGGSNTQVSGDAGSQTISGWGVTGYKLTSEGNGFYSITLKGNFEGFQFVDDPDSPKNMANGICDSYVLALKGDSATDIYMKHIDTNDDGINDKWQWYTDSAFTTKLEDSMAKPAETNIKIHFYNQYNWTTPAIQYWGGSSTTVSGDNGSEEIPGWGGVVGNKLSSEGDNFYSICLQGDFANFQLLDLANPGNNTGGGVSNDTISSYKSDTPKDIYIQHENSSAWKWYQDKAMTTYLDGTQVVKPSFTEQNITVHFKNADNWDKVNAYLGFTGRFNALKHNANTVYGYVNSWPGAEVEVDPDNAGYYSFKITTDVSEIGLIFNNGNGSQTSNIVFTPDSENTEMWVDATGTTSKTAPADWVANSKTINPPINTSAGIQSPVIDENGKVTFNLLASTYTSAEIMGDLSSWTIGQGLTMTKKGDVYTYTTSEKVLPGYYRYKYVVNGSSWIKDSACELVEDDNSILIVPGLANSEVAPEKNVATDLPKTLKLYESGKLKPTDATVTYTLDDTSLSDVVTLDSVNYKITVASGCKKTEFTLTARTADGKEAKLNVKPQEKLYTYTIYYYDHVESHMDPAAADLWIWANDGASIQTPATFTKETMSDGNDWLKTTVKTASTDIGFKARAFGSWAWEDGNHSYKNTAKQDNVTLYYVFGEAGLSTTLPELVKPRERYVLIAYDRPEGDYYDETNSAGWNVYSWNTGLSSETEIYTEVLNGEHIIKVPIRDSEAEMDLRFNMRYSEKAAKGAKWIEKDGSDHSVLVPADQTVVKVYFEQGKGIVSTFALNKSYEIDGAKNTITFYYRDDAVFAATNSAKLTDTVKVVIDGTSYEMTYDKANERYYYVLENCVTKTYNFSYLVGGTAVEDKFASDGKVVYKSFADLDIKATLSQPTMDYNDNNVLSVSFIGASSTSITKDDVESITADLSALGLSSEFSIAPELMEGTISVLRGTTLGTKNIPVTVKDVYGHTYETSVSVEVVSRDEDAFDWDEAVIYMTCTDRFFDGNKNNNTGVDKSNSLGWHGGDFVGLTQKLDYLKDLGVNTIWITPIVANENTSGDGATGYHGYWATDFTKLNTYLGTEAEFATLLTEAHNRDMKIMVDVVLNHAGYGTESYFNGILQGTKMIRDESNTIAKDDVYASVADLPDFVTENPEVRNQIIDWQVDWMKNYDIDYYRVDTVKHVDKVTWQAFKNELTKVNPDFKLIGEYYGAGYTGNGGVLGTGMMDALLDFDANDKAVDFVTGNIANTEIHYQNRNKALNNTATFGSFLSSHDEDSLVDQLIRKEKTEEEALALAKVAAALQITAKGQIVIYQGEEIGQHGLDNYPIQSNRNDFDWEKADAQSGQEGTMLTHYQKLLEIREDYSEVFATGTRSNVASDNTKGYDVFKRAAGDTELFVALNINDTANTVEFGTATANGTIYTDLYSGNTYKVAGGVLSVSIPAAKDGGTMVLVKTGYDKPADTPGTTPGTNSGTTNDTTNNKKPSTSAKDETKNDTTTNKDTDTKVDTGATTETPEKVTVVTPVVDEKVQTAVKNEVEKILQDVVNEEVTEEVLSEETVENIKKAQKNGIDIVTEVIAEVVDESEIDADIKKAMEETLQEKGDDNTGIIQYLDLSVLLKTSQGESLGKVNKLSAPITFTIAVPEEMKQEGRVFVVLRMHDGETTVLETTMNEDGTLSFETDRFSTYALAYIDAETVSADTADTVEDGSDMSGSGSHNTTEDGSNYTTFIILGIVVVVVAAVFIMILALKGKKNNK